MLKKLKDRFEKLTSSVVKLEKEFQADTAQVEVKQDIVDLLLQVSADDTDVKLSLIEAIYKVVGRDTQFSIRDIDDITLKAKLQEYILKRDF